VLVIDQDTSVTEMLTDILQERGYLVVEAYDGHEGLEKARQEKPDLVILDDMISQANDYEVLKALKYASETRDAMVIVLTAENPPEQVIKLLDPETTDL
jgi:DNA-binding response OmpR family regulator